MILIDQSVLRNCSKQIEAKIQELVELNSSLEALLVRIGDSWDGAASEAYIAMMQNYAKQAEDMIAVLREFKSYVDSAVTKFENTDKSCASRIRSVF